MPDRSPDDALRGAIEELAARCAVEAERREKGAAAHGEGSVPGRLFALAGSLFRTHAEDLRRALAASPRPDTGAREVPKPPPWIAPSLLEIGADEPSSAPSPGGCAHLGFTSDCRPYCTTCGERMEWNENHRRYEFGAPSPAAAPREDDQR